VTLLVDNEYFSLVQGSIQGLHFQTLPHRAAYVVHCLRNAIFHVAVDVRKRSPTYGRWVGAELSAKNGMQFFILMDFAHYRSSKPDRSWNRIPDDVRTKINCLALGAPVQCTRTADLWKVMVEK